MTADEAPVAKPKKTPVNRRDFLKGAAVGAAAGAAAVIAPKSLVAAEQPRAQRRAVPLPTAAQLAAEKKLAGLFAGRRNHNCAFTARRIANSLIE
jgi:hypothetical protein